MESPIAYILYYSCGSMSTGRPVDRAAFVRELETAPYNWRPELTVDEFINNLPLREPCPYYRSTNIDCCTGVVVAVPSDEVQGWQNGEHNTEVIRAFEWYDGWFINQRMQPEQKRPPATGMVRRGSATLIARSRTTRLATIADFLAEDVADLAEDEADLAEDEARLEAEEERNVPSTYYSDHDMAGIDYWAYH